VSAVCLQQNAREVGALDEKQRQCSGRRKTAFGAVGRVTPLTITQDGDPRTKVPPHWRN